MDAYELVVQSDDQLLRVDGVSDLTTLSKTCIKLWAEQGRFPRPITLSKTVKVWRLKDIRSWMNAMAEQVGGQDE